MRTSLFMVMSVSAALFAAPALAKDIIGYVKSVDGTASLKSAEASVDAAVGNPVHLNDIILTGKDGAVGVTFKDDTRISIGPETEFTVDAFVYRPRKKQLSFVSRLSRGTLQFVSGTIAKLQPEKVAIKTPAGTIGVRGTRFLVRAED